MRFNHRRRQDEGEFASPKGGFSVTPPQTPPAIIALDDNDLGPAEGELGGFSQPLHVEGRYLARHRAYVDHPAAAVATCTQTPPAQGFLPAKSRQQHTKSEGGVSGKTPPAASLDRIDEVRGLPTEIIAGLRELRTCPAPSITHPEIWPDIVEDALALAIDGWARRALDTGWDVLDLFGVGVRDSSGFEGLAVWLAGRVVGEISESKAHTVCGATFYREAFGRPNSLRLPHLFLWQFGQR